MTTTINKYYKPKDKRTLQCVECNKTFKTSHKNAKFCSKECRKLYNAKEKNDFASRNIPTGTVGAMAELIVSTDLLNKGWEVYRTLSPSSSCDILAIKNHITKTFEVRTGTYRHKPTLRLYYPTKNIKAENLAIVTFSDKKIHYLPELPF